MQLAIQVASYFALLTDTLVSVQLYLWPPCLKHRFYSNTNSVLLHSHKRAFPLAAADTFRGHDLEFFFLFKLPFKRTPQRKSSASCSYQSTSYAVRHNDFKVITVQYFSACFIVIIARPVIVSWTSSLKRPFIPHTSSGHLREPFS